MLRFVYVILLATLLVSCEEKSVKYKYNGVTVTRHDGNAVTYLYYGDCPDNNCHNSGIKISYNGFNNCMGAFLIFNKNGTIEVRKTGCGEFSYSKKDGDRLYMADQDNVSYIKWLDSIDSKFGNIIWISDIMDLEKKENLKNNSKVKTIYFNQ